MKGNLPIISQKKGVAKKRVSKTERQKVLDIFFNSNNCFGVLSPRAILRKRSLSKKLRPGEIITPSLGVTQVDS